MEIKINEKINEKLENDKINICIEHTSKTETNDFIEYINKYEEKKILVKHDNEFIQIDYKDIILFYSNKKENFCKTKFREYKVKNTLYELEKKKNNFIRISKSCIVNIEHINKFDMGLTGVIIVKLDNGNEEIVSRRRAKEILKFIKERSI